MMLKEFEAKELFKLSKIKTPGSKLIRNTIDLDDINENLSVVKAQVLKPKRFDKGGILIAKNKEEIINYTKKLLHSTLDEEFVEEILLEEKANIKSEFYISLLFNSKTRRINLLMSSQGGSGIEDRKQETKIYEISVLEGIQSFKAREIASDFELKGKLMHKFSSILIKMYNCFRNNDMTLLEINPLAINDEDEFIALDGACTLDESAMSRHEFPFPRRHGIRKQSEKEIRAREISDSDHKGVAGKTYLELDGDVAILASGGGASMVAMDALKSYDVPAANYTEYSGNPPAEKVAKLAELTLEKENLNGLFIVGGSANFTRIDITLKAIGEVLIKKNPKFPIVVRRAGQGDKEAFEYLKEIAEEHNLNIHTYGEETPITVAAKIMGELREKYLKEAKN